MKISHTIALALFSMALAHTSSAQVDISIRLKNPIYLMYEPVSAVVQVHNRTGEMIDLSAPAGQGGLELDLQKKPDHKALSRKRATHPSAGTVAPYSSRTLEIDVLDFYDLPYEGAYSLRAKIQWAGLVYGSHSESFDLSPGVEIQRLEAGSPRNPDERRTYTLRTQYRDRGDRLFLRVENEEQGLCYGVYHLGRLIRHFKPVLETSMLGNVHVLHQSGPNHYTHASFTPIGVPITFEHYESELGGAELVPAPDGELMVAGAHRLSDTPATTTSGESVSHIVP